MTKKIITLRWKTGNDTYSDRFDLTEAVTIGRAPRCDILLEDSRVSRTHATLFERANQVYLTNLSQTNPIYCWDMNDTCTVLRYQQEYTLQIDDIFQISDVVFKLSSAVLVDFSPDKYMVLCPQCGQRYPLGTEYCQEDGTPLPESPTILSDWQNSHSG